MPQPGPVPAASYLFKYSAVTELLVISKRYTLKKNGSGFNHKAFPLVLFIEKLCRTLHSFIKDKMACKWLDMAIFPVLAS